MNIDFSSENFERSGNSLFSQTVEKSISEFNVNILNLKSMFFDSKQKTKCSSQNCKWNEG
jgi:hypothetical protein